MTLHRQTKYRRILEFPKDDALSRLNKLVVLLLSLVLVASPLFALRTISPAHASPGTGLVCITSSTTATSCSNSPLSIGPVAVGSTFTVGVFVQGSDPMGGFDIYVKSYNAFVNPTGAALGTLIPNHTSDNICVNEVSVVGACNVNTANGPGVVEVSTIDSRGTNECNNLPPCSGMAFTITYQVIAATPATSLSYPTAPGCGVSSVGSPPNTCVLVSNNVGTTLLETDQGATITQSVSQNSTSTTISCSPASLHAYDVTSCKANVTDTSHSSVPSGTVIFGTNSTGSFTPGTTCALIAGASSATCSLIYSPTVTGHHNITASYTGDPGHLGSHANTNLPVNPPGPGATVTIIFCLPTEIQVNKEAVCTATVTDVSLSRTLPTGSVLFSSNSTGAFNSATNSCVLSGMTAYTASCQVSYNATRIGGHLIIGLYKEVAPHVASLGTFTISVTILAPTMTIVDCSTLTIAVGLTSSCIATVIDTSTTPGTPSGTVTFSTDNLGTFTPTTAQCTLSPVPAPDAADCSVGYTPSSVGGGIHNIGAAYSGDLSHSPSTATPPFPLTVTRASAMSFSSSVSPPSIALGGSATDLATISGAYNPTGPVIYIAYSDSACTTKVFTSSNVPYGSPSNPFTPAAAGTYYFVASYGGDANNNPATTSCGDAGEILTVTSAALHATATGVTCSPPSAAVDASTTCTATVTDTSTSPTTPSGTISFSTDSTGSFNPTSHACNLSSSASGEASCSISYKPTSIGSGSHTISASYSGDSTHKTSNRSASLTVSAPSPTAPLTIFGLSPTIFYSVIGVVVILVIAIATFALRRRKGVTQL